MPEEPKATGLSAGGSGIRLPAPRGSWLSSLKPNVRSILPLVRIGTKTAEAPQPPRAASARRVVVAALACAVVIALAGRHWATRTHHVSRDIGLGSPILRKTVTGLNERWGPSSVTITIDPTLARATAAGSRPVIDAFGAWSASGALLPPLSIDVATTPGPAERDGVNRMIFGPITVAGSEQALAITITYVDDETGAIVEADTIFNSAYPWTALEKRDEADKRCRSRYDLQNVATHEAGHFFGLGEDYQDTTTTMYVSSELCQTSKRVLSSSDVSVMSGLYVQSLAPASQAGCGGGGGQ